MSAFEPSRILGNPHLQTMWATLFRKPLEIPRSRHRFELPDGDFVDVDYCIGSPDTEPGDETSPFSLTKNADTPLLVLFHGLTGSTDSHYILGMQAAMSELGWDSIAMNYRGCSGEMNRLPRFYHSGDTQDIGWLIRQCRETWPDRYIAAIGYSLGGNALVKYLGETGPESCLDSAVVVSAPYQLARCATKLDQGFAKVYRRRLIGELMRSVELKTAFFEAAGDTASHEIMAGLDKEGIKSFWDFDNQIVAPLHGFASAADYYEKASARPYVPEIQTNTLLVHAVDDPFMPTDVAPTEAECPPSVERIISTQGGHVGFISGGWIPWQMEFWLEQFVPRWLQQQAPD